MLLGTDNAFYEVAISYIKLDYFILNPLQTHPQFETCLLKLFPMPTHKITGTLN